MDLILEVNNLNTAFETTERTVHAVKNVSFKLNKGKTLGLVGESGSGKSVTAMSILKLIQQPGFIKSGDVHFENQNLITLTTEQLQKIRGKKISMIFQEPMTALNPVFTIGYQIEEILKIHKPELSTEDRKKKVLDLLNQVGIPAAGERINDYPHQLSGGMRQRVLIAMAISCDPKILIADEPTTALDVTIQMQILSLLKKLQQEMNMSVLLITHDFGVVSQMCDDVLVMKDGEIVESNNVYDLFAKPEHDYTKKLMSLLPSKRTTSQSNITSKALLKIQNVSKSFVVSKSFLARKVKTLNAVQDVSLQVYKGETLGLVGESGCGKSTLSRCLLQLMKVNSGDVFLEDVSVTNLAGNELKNFRKKIQIIFQDPYSSLNPRMKIKDILIEPLSVHNLFSNHQERLKRVDELLAQVGLNPEMKDRYPHEFSGGQRQRIGIARALSVEPEIIVCDEPVSALDVSVQSQVVDLLLNLQKKLNLTYIFVSHDLNLVQAISHRIAVMYLGKIVEIGPANDVFKNPKHPYTKTLIKSILPDDPKRRTLDEKFNVGDLPSPMNLPSGCHFHPRCSLADNHCKAQSPQLENVVLDTASEHLVSCFKSRI